jgi:hypothetical protein
MTPIADAALPVRQNIADRSAVNGQRRMSYLVSLWGVRLLHHGQNFLYSTRPVCFFLFLVAE